MSASPALDYTPKDLLQSSGSLVCENVEHARTHTHIYRTHTHTRHVYTHIPTLTLHVYTPIYHIYTPCVYTHTHSGTEQ